MNRIPITDEAKSENPNLEIYGNDMSAFIPAEFR